MKERLSVFPPLKRVLIFEFQYGEGKSLEEVKRRLERWYCIFHPRRDLLVMRSLAEEGPTKIIFLVWEKNEEGGEIVIIETRDSWYSYEKILYSLKAFGKNAGIKVKI